MTPMTATLDNHFLKDLKIVLSKIVLLLLLLSLFIVFLHDSPNQQVLVGVMSILQWKLLMIFFSKLYMY